MTRVAREPNLLSQNARAKLAPRREPYFRTITAGLKLGYRRGATGGTWVAQAYDLETGKRTHNALGPAKDNDADGGLDYAKAEAEARKWLAGHVRAQAAGYSREGPYRVRDAIKDYLDTYRAGRTKGGGKSEGRNSAVIDAHILPTLGDIECEKLTKRRIENWLAAIVSKPPRVRVKKGAAPKYREIEEDDPDTRRRRWSSANRILTVLKAALNHAHEEGLIPHADAWQRVKPYREADSARIRYLSDEECRRLVNVTSGQFRALVIAGLLTGARYGELAALRTADFDADAATIHIRTSKSGKPRHVVLTDEGKALFARATAGKKGKDLILPRDDGTPWRASHQARPMADACSAASIEPPASFHTLRHTYASRMVMKAAPLMVVAQQLGHSDTRMVEKHYGHLAPTYVAETVRQTFGQLGLATADNVIPLQGSS